jgi:hypothetical protein
MFIYFSPHIFPESCVCWNGTALTYNPESRNQTLYGQGSALVQFLFNFALERAFKKAQANQERLELNGTHELPVRAHHIHLLKENINI